MRWKLGDFWQLPAHKGFDIVLNFHWKRWPIKSQKDHRLRTSSYTDSIWASFDSCFPYVSSSSRLILQIAHFLFYQTLVALKHSFSSIGLEHHLYPSWTISLKLMLHSCQPCFSFAPWTSPSLHLYLTQTFIIILFIDRMELLGSHFSSHIAYCDLLCLSAPFHSIQRGLYPASSGIQKAWDIQIRTKYIQFHHFAASRTWNEVS